MGSRQVLKAMQAGENLQRLQKLGLVGAGVLWLLLFWLSDWDWWPGVIYAVVPLVIVILPGIRRLVDESWGLVIGLLLFALQLMPQVPGAFVAIAWGAAVAAVSACTVRRGQHGWRQWLPWLGIATGIVVLAIGVLVWWSGKSERDATAAVAAQQAHDYHVSKILPSVRGAVLNLVEAVADPRREVYACGAFSEQAAAEFAAAYQAPDCSGALAKLRTEVRSRGDYVNNVWIPASADTYDPASKSARIDACHLTFSNFLTGSDPNPGPQIGVLQMQQQYGNGYLITGYQACG